MTDDQSAIAAIIHAYAERLDDGDLDGVAALFENADWITDGRVRGHGVAHARRQYDRVILSGDGTPRTRHVITNLVVDVAGDGSSAAARSYFVVLQQTGPILAGRYHDRFERDSDGWHLSAREFHADLIGDLSLHYRFA